MAIYGYARVSSNDQNTEVQEQALKKAGCDIIRSEKASGTSRKNRTELKTLLDFIRKDDVLVVTRIDRLARSIGDLQIIISELKAKGASLRCIEQPVDTSTSAGKAFFDMLGVFAEFETNLRRERQMEGIKKAKAEGRYTGRQPTAQAKKDDIYSLNSEGFKASEIATKTGVSLASVYRILAQEIVLPADPDDPEDGDVSRAGMRKANKERKARMSARHGRATA